MRVARGGPDRSLKASVGRHALAELAQGCLLTGRPGSRFRSDRNTKPEPQVVPEIPASAPPGTRTPNLLIKSTHASYTLRNAERG